MTLNIKALKALAERTNEADFLALDQYLTAASPRAILELVERVEALEEALKNQNEWVRGALDCKDWDWNGDQRQVAERSLESARAALNPKPVDQLPMVPPSEAAAESGAQP